MACKCSWRCRWRKTFLADIIKQHQRLTEINNAKMLQLYESNNTNIITPIQTNRELNKPHNNGIGYCPICLNLAPTSKHHIVPRSNNGKDENRNIIKVCKHCHDILEEYADKGIYYSPELARKIRLTEF